jgi:hypothetical protein
MPNQLNQREAIQLLLELQDFKTSAYDFPLAEANLTFSSKFIDLQLVEILSEMGIDLARK